MSFSAQQREQIRLSILRLCLDGCTLGLLTSYLRSEGFSKIEQDDVEGEVEYLSGKELLSRQAKKFSPGTPNFITTEEGQKCLSLGQ